MRRGKWGDATHFQQVDLCKQFVEYAHSMGNDRSSDQVQAMGAVAIAFALEDVAEALDVQASTVQVRKRPVVFTDADTAEPLYVRLDAVNFTRPDRVRIQVEGYSEPMPEGAVCGTVLYFDESCLRVKELPAKVAAMLKGEAVGETS